MTRPIHVSASNIHGLGASQLVQSLLPALAAVGRDRLGTIFVPESGPLAGLAADLGLPAVKIARRLPNAASRVVECLSTSRYYPVDGDMLVLGDLPLALPGKQVLLVHRLHMVSGADTGSASGNAKVAVSRWLFRRNAKYIHRAIVQSDIVGNELRDNFPALDGRISVIPQPAPQWLSVAARKPRGEWNGERPLRLFYPASPYPHKNHALLNRYASDFGARKDVHIVVTLDPEGVDRPGMLMPVGVQGEEGMRDQYHRADALLFPSLAESYGLPLVEAMTLGLPIVAADLPYARSLCGDTAIYFDAMDSGALDQAITELKQRLSAGWQPDYTARLALIPRDWNDVAERMIALFDLR
ncbi:glycosyltransferase [Sphingopyxis sp.]|uniref:glycosyltransferase n=1 Tax=Sphingopyxis sp. TaxID=1908224 RepID=UPI0010F743C6|nr:glycosyltransferase [Sphingopyxis sp.]MBR2172315.1 glycosyltransferase [Sphingopyxis sp.]